MKRAIPLGRYTLGERLGVGGMGEVYLATASGLGGFEKPLALKLLLPHLGEKAGLVDRFLQEAHLAAKMNHVNVAQIFDVGTTDGRFFIAMELVRGVSLSALIKSLKSTDSQVSPGLIAYVGRAVCDGLHHAHGLAGADGRPLGVVHRDVTPHNILVSVDGAVKLTDFGIARAAGGAEDAGGHGIYGKAAYVAPEMLKEGAFDHRADLFSLGVSLYQLATLQNPFRRNTQDETLAAVSDAPLPQASLFRKDLPPELVAVIERSTAKDPAQRFGDARQMRDALPAPPVDAADQLSRMVLSVCGTDIGRIDAHTRELITLGSSRPGTMALATPNPVQTKPRIPTLAVVVGLGVLGLGIAIPFAVRAHAEPKVTEPPAVVAPVPQPVVTAAPAEPPPPVEEPAVAPEPPAHRHKTVPRPATKSARTGYISIDATPWAEVRVDGKLIGETPIASYPVDADGKAHEVELRNPDTKKQLRKSVRVSEGQRTFVRADLQ